MTLVMTLRRLASFPLDFVRQDATGRRDRSRSVDERVPTAAPALLAGDDGPPIAFRPDLMVRWDDETQLAERPPYCVRSRPPGPIRHAAPAAFGHASVKTTR